MIPVVLIPVVLTRLSGSCGAKAAGTVPPPRTASPRGHSSCVLQPESQCLAGCLKSLRPELPDQTHSNEGGHLFLRIQLLSLHLQMAGMLLGGTSRGHICRLRRSVGTGVLLREERLSPLSKLAEQYTPTSSVRKQEAALPSWSNSYPSPQLSFFFFFTFSFVPGDT